MLPVVACTDGWTDVRGVIVRGVKAATLGGDVEGALVEL